MPKINFSLIIPCYNEGPTFETNVKQIITELEKLKLSWEVIFVEDKSTDDTKETLEKIQKNIKGSQIILHKTNTGRGKTVRDGIEAASGEICGFIDVDCEILPSYIPIFIEEIKKGNDMVIATRFYENYPDSINRYISSKIYSAIARRILNLPLSDTEAGYKFFKRERVLPILAKTRDNGWFWDTEICAQAYMNGLKISQVPVLFVRRDDKKSTVRIIPDSFEYLKKLTRFSLKYRRELHK